VIIKIVEIKRARVRKTCGIFKILCLLTTLCGLSSCYSDPLLTSRDNSDMQRMRYAGWDEEKKGIIYHLLRENSTRLAEKAAKKGDFRLIGFIGYKSKLPAEPAGVNCSIPVGTIEIFHGCIPGPPVYYKLIVRYNAALIQQPNFPQKNSCKTDQKAVNDFEKMDREWEDTIKKDAAEKIKKWDEKNKKNKQYN
jgi:hypothetical protein